MSIARSAKEYTIIFMTLTGFKQIADENLSLQNKGFCNCKVHLEGNSFLFDVSNTANNVQQT